MAQLNKFMDCVLYLNIWNAVTSIINKKGDIPVMTGLVLLQQQTFKRKSKMLHKGHFNHSYDFILVLE